jgi:hypothetical protein
MHLHTVHTSTYYSVSPSTATTNTTSTAPCLNVTMTSRVMSGIQKCASALSTSNSSTSINASTAAPTHFSTLHARSDTADKGGLSKCAMIAIGAICVVLFCALMVAATCAQQRGVKSSRKNPSNNNSAKAHNITMQNYAQKQNYRSGAGLTTPPRAHGGRATAPQFPGPRNGYGAQSTRETRNASGTYGNASPYGGGVPTMGGRSTYYH